jgi:alpha-amylase/alpha-mannosidase (GH57 family)
MSTSHVEAYIIPETPVTAPGDKLLVSIVAATSKSVTASISWHRGLLASVELKPGAREYVVEISAPRTPGSYELVLRVEGSVLDRARFRVVDAFNSVTRRLALVWHHHQAPNYLPSGLYHALWAFIHTCSEELAPYSKGPYYHHAVVLEKYREYRCTYNLSPSLLAQWVELIERGVKHNGGLLEPSSPCGEIVRKTLQMYRDAAARGQIDVLTSMYAHSIAGYLIEHLGAEDIVKEEVEYGAEITRRVVGVEPRGAWTPEMAFHMKLVDIYSDIGIEYTVLDNKCHLERSVGDRGSHLEPYVVKGEKGSILVFFRDHEISNALSFKNSFRSEIHAVRSAYEIALKISEKLIAGGTLVVALDGENWMIFSQKPPLTAPFYEKLVSLLLACQRLGYLELATLRDLVKRADARRKLTHVPTTSWLCGFAKWHGEVRDHTIYWERAKRLYAAVREYESKHGRDEVSKRARWALWHALDSDYWWAEFWNPRVIDAWLQVVEELLKPATLKSH